MLNLQISDKINKKKLPKKNDFQIWLNCISKKIKIKKCEINVRIVDIAEIKRINNIFRNKNYPTNIISFPFSNDQNIKNIFFLGDIIICKKIIELESIKFKKKLFAHWAHIFIHGYLHLLGYKHNNKYSKKIMESIEIDIMYYLGYKNPYL